MRIAPHIGVLAVQGGVAEHAAALGAVGAQVTLVRHPRQLIGADGPRLDAIVLPGGESTTQDTLLRLLDLSEPLRSLINEGLPTLGTCAGLILLADRIEGAAPGQRTLGGLDITAQRNAWGSQQASCDAHMRVLAAEFCTVDPCPHPPTTLGVTQLPSANTTHGAFIRAPAIQQVGENARAIAHHSGKIVGATSLSSVSALSPASAFSPTSPAHPCPHLPPLGSVTAIAFHPELTGDFSFHAALATQAVHRLHGSPC